MALENALGDSLASKISQRYQQGGGLFNGLDQKTQHTDGNEQIHATTGAWVADFRDDCQPIDPVTAGGPSDGLRLKKDGLAIVRF